MQSRIQDKEMSQLPLHKQVESIINDNEKISKENELAKQFILKNSQNENFSENESLMNHIQNLVKGEKETENEILSAKKFLSQKVENIDNEQPLLTQIKKLADQCDAAKEENDKAKMIIHKKFKDNSNEPLENESLSKQVQKLCELNETVKTENSEAQKILIEKIGDSFADQNLAKQIEILAKQGEIVTAENEQIKTILNDHLSIQDDSIQSLSIIDQIQFLLKENQNGTDEIQQIKDFIKKKKSCEELTEEEIEKKPLIKVIEKVIELDEAFRKDYNLIHDFLQKQDLCDSSLPLFDQFQNFFNEAEAVKVENEKIRKAVNNDITKKPLLEQVEEMAKELESIKECFMNGGIDSFDEKVPLVQVLKEMITENNEVRSNLNKGQNDDSQKVPVSKQIALLIDENNSLKKQNEENQKIKEENQKIFDTFQSHQTGINSNKPLIEKVDELLKENDELRSQNQKIRETVGKGQINSPSSENDKEPESLIDRIQQLVDEKEGLESQNKIIQERLSEKLQDQIQNNNEENENNNKLVNQLQLIFDQNDELSKEILDAKKLINRQIGPNNSYNLSFEKPLSDYVNALIAENEKLEDEVSNLTTQMKLASKNKDFPERQELDDEIERLSKQINQFQIDKETEQDEFSNLQAANSELKKLLEEEKNKREEGKAELTEKIENISKLQIENENLCKKNNTILKQLSDTTDEIEKRNVEVEDLKKKNEELIKKFKEAWDDFGHEEDDKERVSHIKLILKENDELKKKLEEKENEIKELNQKLIDATRLHLQEEEEEEL